MTLEALDVDEGNIKDYSGLQAIRESRETLAGQKSIDGTRQMKFKVSEGIHRNFDRYSSLTHIISEGMTEHISHQSSLQN